MKMKLFLKNYLLLIIVGLFLLGIFGVNLVQYFSNEAKGIAMEQNWRDHCLEDSNSSEEIMKLCREAQNTEIKRSDFFVVFANTVIYNMSFFNILALFIILIPILYLLCREFKNKIALNCLTRCNYRSYFLNIMKKSYKYVLFLPILFIIMFIFCYFFSTGFNLSLSLQEGITPWSISTISKPIIFIILYLLNLFFHLGLYANIGICIARKNHNFFISLILSFLTIIGIQLFMEIFMNAILFTKVIKTDFSIMFNIMNWLIFYDKKGLLTTVGLSFIYYIISLFIVFILFSNKEKFITDIEKNN